MLRKNRYFNLYIIILFGFIGTASAQNRYDLKQFFNEGKDYYSNFTKWETEDFIKLSLLAGATYGLMNYDEGINEEIQKPQFFNGNIITLFGRFYGEPVTPLLLGGAFLVHGNSYGNDANRRLGFEILQASTYAITVTTLLKYIFGRERPVTANSAFEFHPFSFRNNDFLALPSGHTTLAFSISTVLSENSNSKFLQYLSYLPAVITGLSRIYEDRHWASDVLLGAAIGYFSAKFFTKQHKEKKILLSPEPTPLLSISIPLR